MKKPTPVASTGSAADSAQTLRERAEDAARQKRAQLAGKRRQLLPDETKKLLHELEVHQIELEMQNDELRQAQGELELARAKYFDLFDLAPVGYVTLSEQGAFLEVNLTAALLLGVTRSSLAKVPFTRFVFSDDLGIYQQLHERLVATRESQECELRLRRRDNSQFWVHLRAALAQTGDSALTCRIAMTDITERRRLQASLVQADRLASMGTMAAGIGHEINNPLTYVVSNLETLTDALPKITAAVTQLRDTERLSAMLADAISCAQEALGGALRITKTTQSLNLFSRGDPERLCAIDLPQALDAVINIAANEIKHRARVIRDYRQVPPVWGSEVEVAQLFLNLLLNAAHAIDEGRVDNNEIKIRTWAEANLVCVEVSDTGSGIAPEYLERIFEPFFVTQNVRTATGLGLSICRNIVTGLGGDIRVASQLGKGTQFTVRLRAKPATLAAPPEAPAMKALATPMRRGRILVVDDEEMICKVLARFFQATHEVATAPSGRAAKALLERDKAFDVIVCDLMMPDVTGMELHAWLVAHDPTLAQRMLFMTGGAFTPKAEAYLRNIRTPLVAKPFDADKLKALVDEMVAARPNPAP